jgi:hypothetical protein
MTTNKIENDQWFDNVEIDLLNSLTYHYGYISNSNCCDLSLSNRLAIGTSKCLFILNLNLNWPSPITNTSPSKFIYNYNKLNKSKVSSNASSNVKNSNNSSSSLTKQTIQLDSWTRDLYENRNESVYVNVIGFVEKSRQMHVIYKGYYKLSETCKSSKRKSQNYINSSTSSTNKKILEEESNDSMIQIEDQDNKRSKISTRAQKNSSNGSSNGYLSDSKKRTYSSEASKLIQKNLYEYNAHKQLFEQTKLFDGYLFQHLSSLNPNSHYQQSYQSDETGEKVNSSNLSISSGYKYAKWNKNLNMSLLCSITFDNQIILFDCTSLNINSQIKSNASLDDDSIANAEWKSYDTSSTSKYFNLTEYYLKDRKIEHSILKSTSINDYLKNLNKIIPRCIEWSSLIFQPSECHSQQFQLQIFEYLFVAFKSNEVGFFRICKEPEQEIKIKLDFVLNVNNYKGSLYQQERASTNENEKENTVDNLYTYQELFENFYSSGSKFEFFQITSIKFWHINEIVGSNVTLSCKTMNKLFGVLLIGLSNGDVLIKIVNIKSLLDGSFNMRTEPNKFFKLRNIVNVGPIDKLDIYSLNKMAMNVDDHRKEAENENTAAYFDKLIKLNDADSHYLLIVIQTENRLTFTTVIFDAKNESLLELENQNQNQNLTTTIYYIYKQTEEEQSQLETTNFMLINHFKLINSNLLGHKQHSRKNDEHEVEMEFLLTYENGYMRCLKISALYSNRIISQNKSIHLRLIKDTLVNNSNEINLISNRKDASNKTNLCQNQISRSKNQFLATKRFFLTSNKQILIQVSDFPKLSIIQKKSPQLQINIFSLKCVSKQLPSSNMFLLAETDKIQSLNDCSGNFKNELNKIFKEFQLDFIYLNLFVNDWFNNSLLENNLIKNNETIWLIKRTIYLSDLKKDRQFFKYLYLNIRRSYSLLMNGNKSDFLELQILACYYKRVRILCFILYSYFELMTGLNSFNNSVLESIREASERDEDEDDEDGDEEDDYDYGENESDEIVQDEQKSIVSGINVSSKKEKAIAINQSASLRFFGEPDEHDIINSSQYYRSMFKEHSLEIFKFYSMRLLIRAYEIGFEKLTNKERLLLLIVGEFAHKRNFLVNKLDFGLFRTTHIEAMESTSPVKSKGKSSQNELIYSADAIQNWLKKNFFDINNSVKSPSKQSGKKTSLTSLIDLVDMLRCDICSSKIKIELSNELNSVKCEQSHNVPRCIKSLSPLNPFKYKKCNICNSMWNELLKEDYFNFPELYTNQNNCLFCD